MICVIFVFIVLIDGAFWLCIFAIEKLFVMDNRNIGKTFIRYALPTIVGMMIVAFQSIIDGIFVSRGVGPLGLAAINLVMPLISVLFSVAIMITFGGVVISGVALGEGNVKKVNGYTSFTLLVLFITSMALSVVMLPNLKYICYALGSNDELYPYVSDYLKVILWGLFVFISPSFTEAFVRLRGKPEWVFFSELTSCILNIILDWLFVLEFGWGMKGAAAATVIADGSAALLLVKQIKFGKIVGGRSEVARIFFNGSSEMITSVATAVTIFIFNLILMEHIGYMGVAALTIVYYFNMIVNYSTFGMSQAMYPLVSYNVGAKNFVGVKGLLDIAMKYSFFVGLSVYLLVLFFKEPIIGVFANGNEELSFLTSYAASYLTLIYLFSFINIIGSGFHTAIERPVESAVIAVFKSFVFVIVPLLTLPEVFEDFGWDYNLGIWLSVPVGELFCLIITIPLLKRSLVRLEGMLRQ